MQTASGTAESDVSGVYMNMVTKSGGNRFNSDHNFYFMNDALQGDEHRRRAAGAARARAGPADRRGRQSDRHLVRLELDARRSDQARQGLVLRRDAAGGGSISSRSARSTRTARRRIDDNRIRNFMGKATYQVSQSTRASFMFNRNLKDRFHRRDAPYLSARTRRRCCRISRRRTTSRSSTRSSAGRRCSTRASAGCGACSRPAIRRRSRRPTSRFATSSATRSSTRPTDQSLNPNHRYQANATLGYFADNLGAGTHDFKVGTQLSWEKMEYDRIRNGDHLSRARRRRRRPRADLSNTPVNSDHRLETWARLRAGSLDDRAARRSTTASGSTASRRTCRRSRARPARSSASDRSRERDVFDFSLNVAPRIGISYDLFGNGRTALKAYYGRFYNQFGSELAESAQPERAASTCRCRGPIRNSNLLLDPGELNLTNFTGFSGVFPRMDPDATRPYSDEINVGDRSPAAAELRRVGQLSPPAASRRSGHRRSRAAGERLHAGRRAPTPIPSAARRPSPSTASTRRCVTRRDRVITNVDVLESDYDGVQFSFNKRMSNRWQLLGGLTFQKHEGLRAQRHLSRIPARRTDFNNPNYLLNRDNSAVFTDIPWAFTLSGSYQLPYGSSFSGKYTAARRRPADADAQRHRPAAGHARPCGCSRAARPHRDGQQVRGRPLREALRRWASSRFEGTRRHVQRAERQSRAGQNEAIGTTIGRPSRILAPRIVRFGVTARF